MAGAELELDADQMLDVTVAFALAGPDVVITEIELESVGLGDETGRELESDELDDVTGTELELVKLDDVTGTELDGEPEELRDVVVAFVLAGDEELVGNE